MRCTKPGATWKPCPSTQRRSVRDVRVFLCFGRCALAAHARLSRTCVVCPCLLFAADADGSDPTFYANRAAVLVQLHRHAEAVRDCERAVALKPGYTRAWVRLASAQQALGLFDAAANSFT